MPHFEKTITNDSKYKVSGIIHNNGTEAISVLMKLVRPSNRLDGTNANASQCNLVVRLKSAGSSDATEAGVSVCWLRHRITAQPEIIRQSRV